MNNQPSNAPLETIRDGALKAVIWKNNSENGPYLSVTFARTYTDQDDNPKDTGSFGTRDLLIVSELARNAHYRCNVHWETIREERQPA